MNPMRRQVWQKKKKKNVRNDQILKIYSFNDYEQPELTNSGDVDTYTGPTDV